MSNTDPPPRLAASQGLWGASIASIVAPSKLSSNSCVVCGRFLEADGYHTAHNFWAPTYYFAAITDK